MSIRNLGGGSTLPTVISDMNTNLYEIRQLEDTVSGLAVLPRVVKTGIAIGTGVAGSTVNIDVPHGLGYQPDSANVTFGGVNLPLILDVGVASPLTFQTYFTYTLDATKLRVTVTLSSTSTYAGLIAFPYQLLKSS